MMVVTIMYYTLVYTHREGHLKLETTSSHGQISFLPRKAPSEEKHLTVDAATSLRLNLHQLPEAVVRNRVNDFEGCVDIV